MFAIERQRMIKKLLHENNHVSVAELSCCLNVSEVTIRRDLEKLEGERFLTRTHGGAVLLDSAGGTPPADKEPGRFTGFSEDIAALAAQMIPDSGVIFLDSGPASSAIVPLLSQKQDVIALTCSLPMAAELYKLRSLRVIIPGGTVLPSGIIYGNTVQETLEAMHIGIAFIEADGCNAKGFTTRDQDFCALVRTIGKISDNVVFLCPAEAYGHISFFYIGDLSLADSIITTAEVDDSFKEACAGKHVKLFTTYNL